jgi:hypothetical protein
MTTILSYSSCHQICELCHYCSDVNNSLLNIRDQVSSTLTLLSLALYQQFSKKREETSFHTFDLSPRLPHPLSRFIGFPIIHILICSPCAGFSLAGRPDHFCPPPPHQHPMSGRNNIENCCATSFCNR